MVSTEADARLLGSNAIDREGAGSIPAAASTYRLVESIPRGAASRGRYGPGFLGGEPRCPVCARSGKRVRFCGDAFAHGYLKSEAGRWLLSVDFHCIACRVAWKDSDLALCYVCAVPFACEADSSPIGRQSKHTGTCYHLNSIKHPCCARCEAIVGAVLTKHGRRQLRRMVGLR